jgi:type VI secretion system secreted protein Hcp
MKTYSHLLKLHAVAQAALACLFLTFVASAGETAHLTLTMNNEVIQGESDITTLGRSNTIQCLALESEIFRPGAPATPAVHRPIKLVKRVDKATPKLAEALGQNHTGSGTFRFFRPNPSGDGTTQQFFTVTLAGARVKSHRILLPNTIVPETSVQPLLEEVTLSYTSITIRYENGGIETTLAVGAP